MEIYVPLFHSGKCQRGCLSGSAEPSGRWAHTACAICCLDDVDNNGSIGEGEMGKHYEDLCGRDPALTKCEYTSIQTDMPGKLSSTGTDIL